MIKSLLAGKAQNSYVELFRYVLVGGLAFIVDLGLLYVLTDVFHQHYLISAAGSFTAGLVVNYLLSKAWVFGTRTVQNTFVEFIVFAIIGGVGLGLNELGLWLLTEKAAVYYLHSKILVTGVVFLWNFFARKMVLFRASA